MIRLIMGISLFLLSCNSYSQRLPDNLFIDFGNIAIDSTSYENCSLAKLIELDSSGNMNDTENYSLRPRLDIEEFNCKVIWYKDGIAYPVVFHFNPVSFGKRLYVGNVILKRELRHIYVDSEKMKSGDINGVWYQHIYKYNLKLK